MKATKTFSPSIYSPAAPPRPMTRQRRRYGVPKTLVKSTGSRLFALLVEANRAYSRGKVGAARQYLNDALDVLPPPRNGGHEEQHLVATASLADLDMLKKRWNHPLSQTLVFHKDVQAARARRREALKRPFGFGNDTVVVEVRARYSRRAHPEASD